jgi:hypothetical protein
MQSGIPLRLTGAHPDPVKALLIARLGALGITAEPSETGVLLHIARDNAPALEEDISPHDTPEFAVEKILDLLEEAGIADLDSAGLSGEDEARMEDRLKRLGYLD